MKGQSIGELALAFVLIFVLMSFMSKPAQIWFGVILVLGALLADTKANGTNGVIGTLTGYLNKTS